MHIPKITLPPVREQSIRDLDAAAKRAGEAIGRDVDAAFKKVSRALGALESRAKDGDK